MSDRAAQTCGFDVDRASARRPAALRPEVMEGCGAPRGAWSCDLMIAISSNSNAGQRPARRGSLLRSPSGHSPFPFSTPASRVASRQASMRRRDGLGSRGGSSGVTPSPLRALHPRPDRFTPADALNRREWEDDTGGSWAGDKFFLPKLAEEHGLPLSPLMEAGSGVTTNTAHVLHAAADHSLSPPTRGRGTFDAGLSNGLPYHRASSADLRMKHRGLVVLVHKCCVVKHNQDLI